MAREIKRIVIHCSDSPDTLDIGLIEIDEWHRARFDGVEVEGQRIYCGYHFIVRRDGTVEVGRPEQYVGAHVAGHNSDSLGICWVGRDQIGGQQLHMLLHLVRNLCLRYGLTSTSVYGHRELDARKTCPNLNMFDIRHHLAQMVGA